MILCYVRYVKKSLHTKRQEHLIQRKPKPVGDITKLHIDNINAVFVEILKRLDLLKNLIKKEN